MNTREEIIDALSGKDTDSSPPAVFTQTGTIGQMDHCGSSWPEAIFKANKMAELSLQLHKQFGFATAKVPFCITVEAEALGCILGAPSRDRQPAVVASPYRDQDGIPDVPDFPSPAEYSDMGRLPAVREAAGIVRKSEEVFTIGGCVDPATATMQLLGADDYLVGTLIEPESCRKWIRSLTPLMTEELKQLSEIVDDVQIIAMGDSNLTTTSEFDKIVGEPVRHMITSSDSFTTIHSCGDTKSILGKLSNLGEDGLSVETSDDPEGIFNMISAHTTPIGGIPPVRTLLLGSPKNVSDMATRYSRIGYPIIAPECGVPPNTPDENLMALSQYRTLLSR